MGLIYTLDKYNGSMISYHLFNLECNARTLEEVQAKRVEMNGAVVVVTDEVDPRANETNAW